MKKIPVHFWFFAALFISVTSISVLYASPLGYLAILLTLLFGGVLFLAKNRPDRAFYVLCAGQPVIIACGFMDLWAGLFSVWMVSGSAAGILDLLSSRQDVYWLLLLYGCTFVCAVFVQISNHVTSLLVLLGAGFALVVAVLLIRDHQFRKQYAGART